MDMSHLLTGGGPASVIPAMSQAWDMGEKIASVGQRAEQSAITVESARRENERQRRIETPMYLEDIKNKVPEVMQEPLFKYAQASGAIEMDGNRPMIRTGKMEHIMDNLGKNKILQTMIVTEAKDALWKDIEPKRKAHMELKSTLDNVLSSYDEEINTLKQDAAENNNPVPYAKIDGVNLKKQKFMQTDPRFKQLNDSGAELTRKLEEHNSYVTALGHNETLYKKWGDKYGPKNAMEIALDINNESKVMQEQADVVARANAKAWYEERGRKIEAEKTDRAFGVQDRKGESAETIAANKLAAAKEKELKIAELDRLDEAVDRDTRKGTVKPTDNAIKMIKKRAAKFNMDFIEQEEDVPNKWLSGTHKEKVWKLVDKDTGKPPVERQQQSTQAPAEGAPKVLAPTGNVFADAKALLTANPKNGPDIIKRMLKAGIPRERIKKELGI